ncbi:ComEC/Rec2 family competence protein [Arcobacter vandammei]|uniref:ComEC/Rec2 family competence protein n=1 Tax=Arcobacter vandammei TaxID=2782243 RepID=UPI0018E0046A|nr:ComEC/Rec2 family competence protein [Arcobacter vandammei]
MIINTLKNSEFKTILLLIFLIFVNLSIEYSRFMDFKNSDIFELKAEVINIYKKDDFDIIKLKTSNFEFFSKVGKNENLKKLDLIYCAIDSRKIDFISYLRGFYTHILYFEKLEKPIGFKENIIKNVEENHKDELVIELFNALFLAVAVSSELRDIITAYGIAHVVALSGFHLVVLSFVIYWILYFPYSYFHQKYFPYRNKRFDIMIIITFILFYYLLLTDIVPSLLRAFVLFCLGIFLLRSNIKIISYMTLFYTFLIVIALSPQYIFSIGFWFSIFAVFYIYLFLQYFQNYNKWFLYIFFNIWMFLIFNPIVHYFFAQTALEQFYSIPITIFFNIFYPAEIFAHLFNLSSYFDNYLNIFLNHKIDIYMIKTPFWLFFLYIIFSFLSVFNKIAFIILNFLMLAFNFYLYF